MDGEMADEIAASIEPLRRELERLQEDALFTGEYDGGDAVVTIQAGAGGTDAQDWAEMLLRMYLRWADRPRLPGRAGRGEPGGGGGHQVRDVHRQGRERLRDPQGRARRPPARPPVAVRPGAPAPHVVRAGDRRAAAARGRRASRSTRPTCASTPTARAAPAASTSTRPTRPSGSRTSRRASSSSARTSARRPPNKADGDADPQVAPRRARARRNARQELAKERGDAEHRLRRRRSAATSCTRTSWSRTTAPDSRSATRRACSTATSTVHPRISARQGRREGDVVPRLG